MAAVHLQTVVGGDGTLTLRGLPSLAGHRVDVLVRDAAVAAAPTAKYPLRGKRLRYEKPFDSVAEADWEAGQ
jgi:hypothetical protein